MIAKFVQGELVVILTLYECKGANAQMVLYDNFDAGVINPAKWVGAPNYDPDIREEPRQLVATPDEWQDKRLLLMQRAYSATTGNNGSSGGLFGLSFPNPTARPDAELWFESVSSAAPRV